MKQTTRISALLVTLMLLMPSTALAGIGSLATTPEPPSCDDVFVLAFAGSFPDGCWSVSSLEFVADGIDVGFFIQATDSWQPGFNCSDALVPYGSSETIGPLPAGDYYMFAFEQRFSQRDPGTQWVTLPALTCCDGSSAVINDMRLAKALNGHVIKFSWSNALGASAYNLYGDLDPAGPFDLPIDSATDGTTGIELQMNAAPEFFLLASSSSCGEGPKH